MKTTKEIALIGLFTALLLGGQLALSGVNGVEMVTALLTCFCYSFGVKRGIILVNVFTLIRCLVFGFFPTVVILYLIYYNLFAVVIGAIGNKFNREYSVKNHLIIIVAVMILTLFFTLFDDVITPLFYGLDKESAIAYFYTSLYTVISQEICAVVTVSVLFAPVTRVFSSKRLF